MKAFQALGMAGLTLALVMPLSRSATACPLPMAEPSARLRLAPPNEQPISARFGVVRHEILGFTRMHAGVDYKGPVGEPVKAAATGQVAEAGWVGEFGNRVVIDHGAGYATGYSHMSRLTSGLKTGDCIDTGTVIGFIGATGLVAGPHLHFDTSRHGVWLDPERFLP